MTSLLIDAGNSSLKWALNFDGRLKTGKSIVYRWPFLEQQMEDAWRSFLSEDGSLTKILVANVAGKEVLDSIKKVFSVKDTSEVTIENVVAQKCAYGVTNAYQQYESLGVDRWASLVAARHHISGDACIIDYGTALTMDIISVEGLHKGGIILPGWEMMENSLLDKTKGIDLVEGETPEFLGVNTQEGIQAGILAASVGATEYILKRYVNEIGSHLSCVVTGGAANRILQQLKEREIPGKLLYEPNWVLKGLAVISGSPAASVNAIESGVVV